MISTIVQAELLTWPNKDSRTIKAHFQKLDGETVWMTLLNGKKAAVPMENLSEDDQKWVKARTEPATAPAAPEKPNNTPPAPAPESDSLPGPTPPCVQLHTGRFQSDSGIRPVVQLDPDCFDCAPVPIAFLHSVGRPSALGLWW
ncbi:MAG: hypothetical protein OSA84_09580 [Akkermansiaceae bacterium]|nr:hypothetical protein [Akkermansiaceae bacterium]